MCSKFLQISHIAKVSPATALKVRTVFRTRNKKIMGQVRNCDYTFKKRPHLESEREGVGLDYTP